MPLSSSCSELRRTDCICAAVRRASRAITQFYDLVLAPTGLKTTQFVALREIAEAGEIAQWQMARGYAVAPETLSRRLGMARKKHLVCVRRGPRRGERIYSLTDQGRECLQNAMPYWERAQQRLAQALGDEHLQTAIDHFDRITQAARRAEHIRARNGTSHRK